MHTFATFRIAGEIGSQLRLQVQQAIRILAPASARTQPPLRSGRIRRISQHRHRNFFGEVDEVGDPHRVPLGSVAMAQRKVRAWAHGSATAPSRCRREDNGDGGLTNASESADPGRDEPAVCLRTSSRRSIVSVACTATP